MRRFEDAKATGCASPASAGSAERRLAAVDREEAHTFRVAALTPETATDAVHGWLAQHALRALSVGDWTITETGSALSMSRVG